MLVNQMEASWLGLLEFARGLEPDPALAGLSDRDVERQVRDGASRIAAMTCRWLDHLAELVVRGVWAEQGARTPGQWLSWACGEASSTAREHVRVALALRHLPKIHARFATGTLSYSKVRVLTKVAVPEIEADLLALADSAPASILARLVAAGKRSADAWARWEQGLPVDAGQVYDLRRVPIDQDTVELRVRLPRVDAVAVEERLDRLVDRADRASEPTDRQPAIDEGAGPDGHAGDAAAAPLHRDARRVIALCDALAVAVADDAPDRSGADDHLVVLHVDAADLAAAVSDQQPDTDAGEAAAADRSGGDAAAAATGAADTAAGDAAAARAGRRGRAYVTTGRNRSMMLPRRVLARLTCDADLRLAGAGEGHPADIGRRSRKVPPDLRRAVLLRDRHCRFPGCHRTRGLHAHHVLHWARGGPTDLDNLLLLCAHHHGFVHDHGWSLKPIDPVAGRWTFHAPDQPQPLAAVLPMPGAAAASLDPITQQPVPELALQPPWWDGDGYDLNETVTMISEMLLDLAA